MFSNNESCGRSKGCMFGLCLLGAAGILSYGMFQSANVIKESRRVINAVGSAEMTINANYATAEIQCIVVDQSADLLDSKLQDVLLLVQNFLTEMKVKPEEIKLSQELHYNNQGKDTFSKGVKIEIASSDVQFIQQLVNNAVLILNKHPAFKFSIVKEPVFQYRGLDNLKKELLPLAVKNVYDSAAQMISGTKQKLGSVISIRQGYISEYNNYEDRNKMAKKAKLVVEASFDLV